MRRATAFTLIELILVVAIIGILAGLVLSAMNMIRISARTVECASNLRQLGLCLSAFTADNRGRIPPPNIDNDTGNPIDIDGIPGRDVDQVGDYGNGWGFLRRYLPEVEHSGVFVCPDGNWTKAELRSQMQRWMQDPDRHFEADTTWYQNSYGYNRDLGVNCAWDANNKAVFPGRNRDWLSWRLNRIERPSETVAITEQWSIDQGQGPMAGTTMPSRLPFFRPDVDPVRGTGHQAAFEWDKWAAIRLSHRDRANHVFYDGSVRAVDPVLLGAGRTANDERYWGKPNSYRGKF